MGRSFLLVGWVATAERVGVVEGISGAGQKKVSIFENMANVV